MATDEDTTFVEADLFTTMTVVAVLLTCAAIPNLRPLPEERVTSSREVAFVIRSDSYSLRGSPIRVSVSTVPIANTTNWLPLLGEELRLTSESSAVRQYSSQSFTESELAVVFRFTGDDQEIPRFIGVQFTAPAPPTAVMEGDQQTSMESAWFIDSQPSVSATFEATNDTATAIQFSAELRLVEQSSGLQLMILEPTWPSPVNEGGAE